MSADLRHDLAAAVIRRTTPWLDVDQVAAQAKVTADDVAIWMTQGRVFSLADNREQPIFPKYLFDPANGKPYTLASQVIGVFQRAQFGPWDIAAWMATPNPHLKNAPPMAMLDGAPADLLLAAANAVMDRRVAPAPTRSLRLRH